MDDSGALFDVAGLRRAGPVDDGAVEVGAGIDKRFRSFEPDAIMLVPPSLDEWLPENHLSRFIAEVVDANLDLTRFYSSYRKVKGQPPYDPRLMVRVLLYGYCGSSPYSGHPRLHRRAGPASNRGGAGIVTELRPHPAEPCQNASNRPCL